MKDYVIVLALLLASFTTVGAQDVILSEDFNRSWSTTNPPPGWQIQFTDDTSSNDWHRAPDLGFNPWSDNPTPYAALGPGEEGVDILFTPYLDFFGCTNVTLRCSLGFIPGGGNHQALIKASVDSGPFIITIDELTGRTIEPGLLVYELPWATNKRGVRIQFILFSDTNGITYWVLDNFSITAQRRATDVGVTQIIAPADTVDSNAVIHPACQVKNHSAFGSASFWTHCYIPNYHDSIWTGDLQPGDSTTITFGSYLADTFGFVHARFQTFMEGDLYPENDTASKRVFVRPPAYNDGAAIEILAPPAMIVESTVVLPTGIIANLGTQTASLSASFEISILGSPVYSESITKFLPPNQPDTVIFPSWIASPAAFYTVRLRVSIERDINPENDIITFSLTVRAHSHDVGAVAIISPLDTIPPGIVTPEAKITNFGTYVETGFNATLKISKGNNLLYEDSVIVPSIQPGETLVLSFYPWAAPRGSYTLSCSTCLINDDQPENDNYQKTVLVRTPIHPGWQEVAPVPLSATGKPIKDGGALAPLHKRIFVLRGNRTDDFLAYNIEVDTWQSCAPIPPGSGGKTVYKGGALSSDGYRYIYATKGYSTFTFLRYDAWGDSWQICRDVPPGPSRKPIKGGTRMVYVTKNDTGYVYLLKGYKNEFWRYNTITDTWELLPNAPLGPSGKDAYKEGSFIVYDGENTIYAVKAKYNEVFAFDIGLNRWLTTAYQKFPLAGRSGRQKKVKDGAGGGWWNNAMYCLKGGNTCEFWRFLPQENRWEELDTIPQLGSSGRKKKVKQGGGIASLGNGLFFALKGGKTSEFWCYKSPETGPGVEEKPIPPAPSLALKLFPNPANKRVFGSLGAQLTGKARITVYDATGRSCLISYTERPNFTLDLSHLNAGVYFVQVNANNGETTAKLILR